MQSKIWEHAKAASIEVRDVLTYLMRQVERIEGLNACAFSLSEEGDLLSQWRGYCPASGGYSLGFRSTALRSIAHDQDLVLGPCLYESKDQLPLIDEIANLLTKAVTDLLPQVPQRGQDLGELVAPGLFAHLSKVAPFIKSDSFAEESEWRLVFTRTPLDQVPVDIRVAPTLLVPYAIVDLSAASASEAFGEIVVGPCAHPELSMRAVSLLLKVAGTGGVSAVRRSAVPFRAF
jgi:hypothetical protein